MGAWAVEYHDDFEVEVRALPERVQDKLASLALLLEAIGPSLGRPHVDTLKGSKHANMKELRFSIGKAVWRVAFAFDTKRKAILLVGGDKQGAAERAFYRWLIKVADERFDRHLARGWKMTVPLKRVLARMSPERRARVEAEAKRMIAEELTLRDLRKAFELTQEKLAKRLGVRQESISNIEKRSDLLLSTLQSYVAALGGDLRLLVTFPDRPPVTLKAFSDVADGQKSLS